MTDAQREWIQSMIGQLDQMCDDVDAVSNTLPHRQASTLSHAPTFLRKAMSYLQAGLDGPNCNSAFEPVDVDKLAARAQALGLVAPDLQK